MPESKHSFTLFSSAYAVSATIGAEYPASRMSRVDCSPSITGICMSISKRSYGFELSMLSLTFSKAS